MHQKHIFLTLGLLLISSLGLAQDQNPIRIIVKWKQPPANAASLASQIANVSTYPVRSIQPIAGGAYSLTFEAPTVRTMPGGRFDVTTLILNRLRNSPNVVYAVKDRLGHVKPLPHIRANDNDTFNATLTSLSHESQWDEFSRPAGIMLESAPYQQDGAWAYTTGHASSSVIVAVLDTGITLNNSLVNNFLKTDKGDIWGWNFAANDNNLFDETRLFHGSHVAGTIAAYGGAIKGMGENLKLLPIKIPDKSGLFYESAVINAIYWAVGEHVPGAPENPYPAKVINISFGVDEAPGEELTHCDEALQDALWHARQKGTVVVAAAGNDNRPEHFNAPAVCPTVLRIAATGPEGLRAYYSNYGPSVTFAAPGGDFHYGREGGILSTVNPEGGIRDSGLNFYQGTSMAAPHAAGVAGLIFAVNDNQISPREVEEILYSTTHLFGQSDDPNHSCVGKKSCGHGILDAEQAVKAALAHYDDIFSAPIKQSFSQKKRPLTDSQDEQPTALNHWLPLPSLTPPSSEWSTPHVKREADGKIYAYSASKTYLLNETEWQHCEVIGFDGVGCYR